jgi:hypothetical protein
MLVIRDQQMLALEAGAFRDFLARLPSILLNTIPDLAERATPEALKLFTDRTVLRARSYGFESQRDVFIYVSLSALLGEGALEADARALCILTGKGLPGSGKAQMLLAEAERLAWL